MAVDDVEMDATSTTERFPAEVLCLIFEHLRPSRSKLASGKLMHSDDNSLLSICHVCRFWRKVVFAHAALWASEVDVSAHPHPNLTKIVLGFSNSLPLDVKLHYVTDEYDYDVLALWFEKPHRSRIRSLDIETTGEDASQNLVDVIGSEFPALHTLKLLNEPEEDPMRHSYEEPPPPDLARVMVLPIQHAPALKRIELRDYVLSWNLVELYATVEHLEVHISGELDPVYLPTHAQLRAVLASMHSLKTLILDDVFPEYTGTEPESSIAVPDTCCSVTLRAARYHGNCRTLASSFILPSGCSLSIAQVCKEDADAGAIIGDFAGSSHRPQVASIRTDIEVTECGEFSIAYDASTYLNSPESLLPSSIIPGSPVTFFFEITTQAIEQDEWYGEESIEASYDSMQAAMTRVDLTDLRVLRLDEMREPDEFHLCNGMEAYHGERTTPVLAAAENVEILVLGDTSLHILMFLKDPDCMTGNLILPRLATVVVPEGTKPYSANSLREYFDARAKDGLPIPAVRAPQSLEGTSFAQDLGVGVRVTYF